MLTVLLQNWFIFPLVEHTRDLMWFVYLFPLAALVGYAVPCGIPLLAALRKRNKADPGDGMAGDFPFGHAIASFFASFLLVEAVALLLWIVFITFFSEHFPALLNIRLYALMKWTGPARFLLPVILVARKFSITARTAGTPEGNGPFGSFSLVSASFLASLVLDMFFSRLPGGAPGPSGMADDLIRFLPVGFLAYSLFITCIAAPIAEELFFRGLLLAGYERVMGKNAALVCQAVAFALIHDTVVPNILFRFFVHGLLLGIIRKRTGSLVPGMVYHIAWNSLWVGLAILRLR